MDGPRVVAVGSQNPTKVAAVRAVLGRLFPGAGVVAVAVDSGVRVQPVSLGETRRGALHRAEAALAEPGADWGIGLEGGVDFDGDGRAWLCGAVTVAGPDGARGHAISAMLPLPDVAAARVRAGAELGPVMDALTGESGTKQRQGAIGILTGGLVPRQEGWQVTVACALAPFVRPDLYRMPGG